MSLLVKRISFNGYRNLGGKVIEPAAGITVLVGPNATGKTNTVEALQFLTSGTSFRRPSPAELLAPGEQQSSVVAVLEGDGRVLDVEMVCTPEKRKFVRNGKPCRGIDLPGNLLSVLFCPDDLSFVKGSASKRRGELDAFGAQANSGYRKVLSTYTRSVEQRNRLLKDGCDPALLDAWDESVALGGATLLHHRLNLFERLHTLVAAIYGEVVPGESLSCEYVSSVEGAAAGMSRDELRDAMVSQMQAGRDDDVRRGQTLVGPHRDDISFSIDGRDARTFGSQGQQRTVALAWKMAEVRLCEDLLDQRPLLLLDDVMSELDENRRACVTDFVQGGIQTVITTTNLGYFSDDALGRMKVVEYGKQ